jgi:hypothetical protein
MHTFAPASIYMGLTGIDSKMKGFVSMPSYPIDAR